MDNIMITKTARSKFAKAHGGAFGLPVIQKAAYGNAGYDELGQPIILNEDMTEVSGEFIQITVNKADISFPTETSVRVITTLGFDVGNGKRVSAVGLYDSDGDLIAVKVFPPINKDDETAIETIWDEIF